MIYISQEQMGRCKRCGCYDDLRMGTCFDCADAAERRAAQRSAGQHIGMGFRLLREARWTSARICFLWAWERWTRTGDYAPGGVFEREYGIR